MPSTSVVSTSEFRFDRPASIDDATFARIVFIRPLESVIQPIVDHNMQLIEAVRRLAAWYRGETDARDPEPLSELLNPQINEACDFLRSFVAVATRYNPGEFPAHCCKMRELEFTTRYLVNALRPCLDAPVLDNALGAVSHFFFTLGSPISARLTPEDWTRRVNGRLAAMVRSFGDIAEACRVREQARAIEIAAQSPAAATAEDVAAAARDVGAKVDAAKAATVAAVRKARHAVIKDAHTARKSEADRRIPKGERGRQIAAVRNLVREARANGRRMTILQACRKAWSKVKGGYPSAMALYDYCHSHSTEF